MNPIGAVRLEKDGSPMLADLSVHRQLLAKAQWLKTLAKYRRYEWVRPHHNKYRREERHSISCFATLTLEPSNTNTHPTVYPRCSILDASGEGLGIRTYRRIPSGTRLAMDLHLGDVTFSLVGRVTHSTGAPGAFRVGVKLDFSESPPS